MKLTMENVLSYDKTFGKHKVGAVIGYTIEKTDWVQSAMSKKDFISNDTPVFDAGNVLINPEKPDVPLNKNDAFQKVQKRRVQEKR